MLRLSFSPHIYSGLTTRKIMARVLFALLPATVFGVLLFGPRALAVCAVCTASAVASEFIFNKVTKNAQSAGDLSAAVTGLLLALCLPASIPLWQALLGAVFAIVIVKCAFGGIGQNFANPAACARVFMTLSFAEMANSAEPYFADTAAGATPLVLKNESISSLFFGLHGGAIGETCAFALLLGGIYLLFSGVITPHAPLAMLATVFFCALLAQGDALFALRQVLSGGLMLGAFFMATDYTTTPATASGKILFGAGAGLLTAMIRFFGVYAEGVAFALLLMNIITPYIDTLTAKKPFGGKSV